MAAKNALPKDRTELSALWASAVTRVDECKQILADAEKYEAEVWEALKRSRSESVKTDDY